MSEVGSGKFTYECIENYQKLPAGMPMGPVSAMATDAQDRLYTFQRANPAVVIFDRDGTYLSSWGLGAFKSPHGFVIQDDIVYITDRDDSIAMTFTLDGRPLQILGQRGVHSDTGCEKTSALCPRAAGPFNYPTELIPSPWGDLYVTDGYRNASVHRFTKDGKYLMSWGRPGKTEPGQFHLPHGIVIDNEKLYVADRANARVQIFDPDGKFIDMWTGMTGPNHIAKDKEGYFYICEQKDDGAPGYVSIRDASGKVLARWASRACHGLWVDSHGDIYIASPSVRAVDKYVRKH